MANTKVSKFEGCVFADDFVRRLDFLGIYLEAPLQRDLRAALEDAFSERYTQGWSDGENYADEMMNYARGVERGDDD